MGEVEILRGLEEIAARLRTNRDRVRGWVQDPAAGFPAFRHGGGATFYAVAADVDAWLLARRREALAGLGVIFDPDTGQVRLKTPPGGPKGAPEPPQKPAGGDPAPDARKGPKFGKGGKRRVSHTPTL